MTLAIVPIMASLVQKVPLQKSKISAPNNSFPTGSIQVGKIFPI